MDRDGGGSDSMNQSNTDTETRHRIALSDGTKLPMPDAETAKEWVQSFSDATWIQEPKSDSENRTQNYE